ncbi:hypothetical protein FN846DRAFT_895348 [Sphaerosporella brunnea]|uniref:Uncharacterized protein n=1 Tax=Sphaerosporella brunnea TaxID=1250544 RepID=A0A5J5EGT9_9PEZI|nr:hypothetical protein FN846DRAFT_895348 [Sphaerosporella brunnea]
MTSDLYAPLSDLYARFRLARDRHYETVTLWHVYGEPILSFSVVPSGTSDIETPLSDLHARFWLAGVWSHRSSPWWRSDCVQTPTQDDHSSHAPPNSTNITAAVIHNLDLDVHNSVVNCNAPPTNVGLQEGDTEIDNAFEEEADETRQLPADPDPSALDLEFQKVYHSFEDSHKWRLSSGCVVEDTLYEAYEREQLSPTLASMLRDWTIDLDNKIMQAWFSAADWAEICQSVPTLPQPKETFVRSFARFRNVQTTSDLRNVLSTVGYLPEGVSFNREEHFDLAWADNVVLYCSLTPRTNRCAGPTSKAGITFESKEGSCRASALRKNRNRTGPTERMKSGPRLDGIIRSIDDDVFEYGGTEVARTFQGGTKSTKWMHDSRKLAKALRDMLHRLCQAAHKSKRGKVQVVGFITAGLVLESFRLCNPQGYVCVLKRQSRQQVPTSVKHLKILLSLLISVVQMKQIVAQCVDAVRSHSHAAATSEEEWIRELLNTGAEDTGKVGLSSGSLPWSADTP